MNIVIKKSVFLLTAMVFALFATTSCEEENNENVKGVVPAATSISPSENLRPGDIVTIKGTNLDYVKEVRFGERYLIAAASFVSVSANEIQIQIPAAAPGGEVHLIAKDDVVPNQLAGTVAMLMPAITDINPMSIEIGGEVTATGTDLDLFTKVTVNGVELEILEVSSNSMRLKFPDNLLNGGLLTFEKANGETVVYDSPVSITAPVEQPTIVAATPETIKMGQLLTITGTNLDLVAQVFFADVEATAFGTRNASMIEVTVPDGLQGGTCTLKLVTTGGYELTAQITINLSATDPVADPSLLIFDFEDVNGNNAANIAGGWGGIANGKSSAGDGVSGSFFEITAENWNPGAYWWVADNWCEAPFPTISGIGNYVIKMDIRLRQDIPFDDQVAIRLRISGNKEINFIPFIPVENGNFTTKGDWLTITMPTDGLPDPTVGDGDWGIVSGYNPNAVNFTGFCTDNIRYELKP